MDTSIESSNTSGADERQPSCSTISSVANTKERTAKRLQAFDFERDDDEGDKKRRTLWEPKNLPDVLSQDSEETDVGNLSDGSDNGDSQGNEGAKVGNNKGKAESQGKNTSGTSKSASKKSVSTFLDKFSTASSGKKSQVKYTPLEQQFMAIKEQYSDAVLLVECGYKYRFFGQDAEVGNACLLKG